MYSSDTEQGPSTMTSQASELRALYERLEAARAALDTAEIAPDEAHRVPLRETILSLHGDVERLMEELEAVREQIRPLVARYRAAYPRPPKDAAPAQPTVGSVPIARIDHLGSSTYRERGWSSIAAGDYERAVDELERALELAPEETEASSLLGWALMRIGRLAEARERLERVLTVEPEHAMTQVSLGYVCLREGRFAEAIEALSALARGSGDRKAQLYANLYLGMVYAEREMYRDARGFLERAVELGPNLIEAQWELGLSHYREGGVERALGVWRAGAEANRFSPWGERCREAVARLEAGESPGG